MDNADDRHSTHRPPRKPRIEVLRAGPAAAPEPAAAPAGGQPRTDLPAGDAQAPSPTHSPVMASARPVQPEAPARRRRGGLLRSPAVLLALLALLVVAAALGYTASQRDKGEDPDYAVPEDVAGSQPAQVPADEQVYVESPPAAEPGEEPAAAQAAPAEPSPAEPGEVAAADAAEPPARNSVAPAAGTGAAAAVRAFYGALSTGDGASAAQWVVPAKRQRGPLSAGALSRYYSSFRRPLRLRRVTPVDANTVRVAYDYVLADGRLCEGQAAVNVVQSGDRSLVSGIRTQGPC